MYCDIPVLRRCCFCLPLRPGLIVWGYLKMTVSIVLIAIVSIILSDDPRFLCSQVTSNIKFCVVMWPLMLAILIVDAIFQYIFLLAAHTKNTKLMKWYLCYRIFLFVISNIVFLLVFVDLVVIYGSPNYPYIEWLIKCFIVGTLNAVLQFYIILLVKSEVRKLNNDCYVIFGNHDGNPKCSVSLGNPTNAAEDLQQLTTHDAQ